MMEERISFGKKKNILTFFRLKEGQLMLLSFALPFFISFLVLAVSGVHPFGDKQIIATDFWHQYFPMIRELRRKLVSGSSLLYTWNSGLGTNFINIIAYYCASPLNLLTLLVPDEFLRDALSVILIAKIGVAGLTFSVLLTRLFPRRDIAVVLFSSLYALSAFFMGYYWNIMWLDSAALFPLVVLGEILLIRDGKPLLYTLSLAACLFCNYYIGFYICIAVVLFAPAILACTWRGMRSALGSAARMTVYSLLSGGLAATLLLPAFLALRGTYSAANNIMGQTKFNGNALTYLSALFPFSEPNTLNAQTPNICCGLICVILFIIFLTGKFRLREKICALALLSFIMFSFMFRPLDFLWNGGHYANMIPYRYSFIFSFVLLLCAYRAYTRLHTTSAPQLIAACALPAAFAAVLYFTGYLTALTMGASVVGCSLYLILFSKYVSDSAPTKILACLFCLLLTAECACAGAFGFSDCSTYSSYLDGSSDIAKIANRGDSSLVRSEMTSYKTLNDPLLYGYKGVSQFSSGANAGLVRFMTDIGAGGYPAGNRYAYQQNTDFVNSILAVKYLINRSPEPVQTVYPYLNETDKSGTAVLYENTNALPVAFLTYGEETELSSANKILAQNTLFTALTGFPDGLFTALTDVTAETDHGSITGSGGFYSYTSTGDSARLKFTFNCTYSGTYCILPNITDADRITIKSGGTTSSFLAKWTQASVLPAGYHEAGDTFTVEATVKADEKSRSANVRYACMNDRLFLDGMEKLSSGALTDCTYSDTSVSGNISSRGGTVFTSVPYEKGWSVYVDGERVETHAYNGAFVSFDVPAGSHTVEMKYSPDGFKAGTLISLCSALSLALICTVRTAAKKRRH